MDFVLIVKDIQSFIWVNALRNVQLKLFSTVILVFNVHNHKFGTVLIVSVDVQLERFGLMETAFVQTITNGMDTIVPLVLRVKSGMQALEFVTVHQ